MVRIFFILLALSFFPFHAYAATASNSTVLYLVVGSTTPPVTPPTIALIGANPLNLIVGDAFTDPGATASDTEGDDLTGSIVETGGPVNTAAVGTTVLTYRVTSPHNGLSASVTRTVMVNPQGSVTPPPEVPAAGPRPPNPPAAAVRPLTPSLVPSVRRMSSD